MIKIIAIQRLIIVILKIAVDNRQYTMINMKTHPIFLASILFFVAVLLASCAQNSLRIGNSVNLCCPGDYASYKSFGIETQDMPLFLRDYVVEEFSGAFQERGLVRNDQINDLRVTLAYRHINLDHEQEDIDPFIRQESIDVQLRYIATIDIIMKETSTNKAVWAGEVHRIHVVSPGEYMHTHRAVAAFRETFHDLLQHYPALDQ